MHKSSFMVLAVLVGLSFGAQAKGMRFKSSSGGHSHASQGAPSANAGGTHLPSFRPRNSASAAGQAAVPAAAGLAAGATMTDKLNAELLAQRAATPPAPPVGQLKAKPAEAPPLASNERRISQPLNVGKPQQVVSSTPIDVSYLVPRDSAKGAQASADAGDLVNRRGVNCSNYPGRCR